MPKYKPTKTKSDIAKNLITMFKNGDELSINKIAIKFGVNAQVARHHLDTVSLLLPIYEEKKGNTTIFKLLEG